MPVRFIPAYNPLVEEALNQAEEKSFEGVPVRVLRLEYLIAIMVQTGRPKDRQHLAMLTGNASIDEALLSAILHRHNLITAWKTTNPDC
ncbi:MAG TPA: hypothetical protein VG796_21995 [Verrucomicrobiales bacterium]|nr:hypothetical protein [Verrucomicrobiales bacterium]